MSHPVRHPVPRLESAGLDGWLVRLFDDIDEANLAWIEALMGACEENFGAALIDLVPSYTTLLVCFDPLRMDGGEARRRLLTLLAELRPREGDAESAPLKTLPVWYDESVGPELKRLAAGFAGDIAAVIHAHTQAEYRVFALGFAPGFAFMGGLPASLEAPRLATPRRRVPAGSVAVAGRQTAAYPTVSPGGWNLLGRTPMALFDRHRQGHSLLVVGDRVRFEAVDRETFIELGGDPTPMEEGA